jgi:hypothetical protein
LVWDCLELWCGRYYWLWNHFQNGKMKTVLELWGIIGVVGTDMRTGWGPPGCSVSDTRPTPGWRFPARELWCLSFRVCWVQGFVLLFLWEDISWEVVLFCFVCLFVCCCGAWEWEIFIARYVWRRRWCAGDGTLLLFFFVLFSEVEKSLNWFFFLRMGEIRFSWESGDCCVNSVFFFFFSPLWLPHLGFVSWSFPQGSKSF